MRIGRNESTYGKQDRWRMYISDKHPGKDGRTISPYETECSILTAISQRMANFMHIYCTSGLLPAKETKPSG